MSTVTGSFTAVNQASSVVSIASGQQVSTVLSGTWIATVMLQRALDNAGWVNVRELLPGASGADPTLPAGTYRLFCTRYISGTVGYSLTGDAYSDGVSSLTVSGNSMPIASIFVPPGYCQLFSEYLEIAAGNLADIQLTAILEIT